METREVTDRVLFDVFVTACEGGVNYWAQVSDYHIWECKDPLIEDLKGFQATLSDHEDYLTEWTVTGQTILRGLHRMADARAPYYDPNGAGTNCASVPFLGKHHHDIAVKMLEHPNLDIDFDASFADDVIQAGLFGEVRYG